MKTFAYPSIGFGLGAITRSILEDKHKKDSEKEFLDHLISWGPLGLGAVGLGTGVASDLNKILPLLRQAKGLFKIGALKDTVKLREHQDRSVDKLLRQDGRALMAHATGTGKTLTGIAGFEKLKEEGKASKAIVVVPAGLRDNFITNLKKFTNSTYAAYGPKNEKTSLNVDEESNADYTIIGYELFRQNRDEVMKNSGADTLIVDEVHRARNSAGATYEALTNTSEEVKNVLTLTGSLVNNEPADIVPLMDITFGRTGHDLGSKDIFEKLFVHKDAKTDGWFNPKVTVTKSLKNIPQLGTYLSGKVDYVPHSDLEEFLPTKDEEIIKIPMSKKQTELYNYSMDNLDALTRWKIKNNIPVPQREISGLFGKLMKARQVSTDPSIMDPELKFKDPAEYSPKVKKIIEDLETHLDEDSNNRVLVYGNLVDSQVETIAKALDKRGKEYSKFIGTGRKGVTNKSRKKSLEDFKIGKNRIMLLSSAGGEGLDLPEATMLQMIEGHYNPEKIQQVEARARRVADKPQKDKVVKVKKYISVPASSTGLSGMVRSGISKLLGGSGEDAGVEQWIYSVADRKDKLNAQFRGALNDDDSIRNSVAKTANADEALLMDVENIIPRMESAPKSSSDIMGEALTVGYLSAMAKEIGNPIGKLLSKPVTNVAMAEPERKIKELILRHGNEELTKKRHYDHIFRKSKLDERLMDASFGVNALTFGGGLLAPSGVSALTNLFAPSASKYVKHPLAPIVGAFLSSLISPSLAEIAKGKILGMAVDNPSDLQIGINKHMKDLRKKALRKYKSSNKYINEFDTRERLGLDVSLI